MENIIDHFDSSKAKTLYILYIYMLSQKKIKIMVNIKTNHVANLYFILL